MAEGEQTSESNKAPTDQKVSFGCIANHTLHCM